MVGAKKGMKRTRKTWNPFKGCSYVNSGCDDCASLELAAKYCEGDAPFKGLVEIGPDGAAWTGDVRYDPKKLHDPFSWSNCTVQVQQLGDLFHPAIEEEHLDLVFGVMADTLTNKYYINTMRPGRWIDYILEGSSRQGFRTERSPANVTVTVYPCYSEALTSRQLTRASQ